jgi:hypothetical protein
VRWRGVKRGGIRDAKAGPSPQGSAVGLQGFRVDAEKPEEGVCADWGQWVRLFGEENKMAGSWPMPVDAGRCRLGKISRFAIDVGTEDRLSRI